MSSAVREFLEMPRVPIDEMEVEALKGEVDGWRTVSDLLPREVFEWMARLHDVVRFTKRNYQGATGILMGFKLEPVEYTVGMTEAAYDTLHGKRVIEDKVLVIPAASVMYIEFIGDTRDYDSERDEAEIGETVLG